MKPVKTVVVFGILSMFAASAFAGRTYITIKKAQADGPVRVERGERLTYRVQKGNELHEATPGKDGFARLGDFNLVKPIGKSKTGADLYKLEPGKVYHEAVVPADGALEGYRIREFSVRVGKTKARRAEERR